jgi:methyl-accepting chemotaxis protein
MTFKRSFSIPVTKKHQTSMKRKLFVFSLILFLLIFILGSVSFTVLMGQIMHRGMGYELKKAIEIERLKLTASVNGEIAIILKMADSPLIRRYFLNPDNPELREMAFEEISAYRRVLRTRSVFWVNDKDKVFYITDHEPYIVDPEIQDNYWYNMTLYETEVYNFNINYNPNLNVTNLWINAPVFDDDKKPIGMVGTYINISNFINDIYDNYPGNAELYFFNPAGEITGARNIDYIKNKVNITQALGQTGEIILSYLSKLDSNEIRYFETYNADKVIIVGSIHALGWYVAAVYNFTFGEELNTGMTVLFGIMMLVIFSVFVIFNVFVARLLEPLHCIIKEISQISTDWDFKHESELCKKNEIETLGEFLNMTIIDSLTGLYNRRFFDGSMKKIIKALSRTEGNLSILMIDIDFFKNYNDTYGHNKGDKCLNEVATILSKCITREEDFIARYGGEEFVAVLPNTDENGTHLIAERLISKIRESKIPHKNSDITSYVTISIGGTTGVVKHYHKESDYIKLADSALYKSKQDGRNLYTFVKFKE